VSAATAVLGMVSRLVTQKGIDLLEKIADPLMNEDVVLVALVDGEPYYENLFRSLAERFSGQFMARIGYDETMAHKVHAGSDILLMPSRYEPGGLTQIYSMKYGTVPVVRATGGLDDTVEEWNPETQSGTGFKFHGYNPEDFLVAIQRALGVFRDKNAWQTLMRNDMTEDFSWSRSAAEYVEVYEDVARRRS
jgi:starch synthase